MEAPTVQMQNVNPIPDLGAPREGQHLVDRDVPEIQSPAQVRIRLDREKAKRAVEGPLDLGLFLSATNQGAAKGHMRTARLGHVESGCPQRRDVEIEEAARLSVGVVKHVHILGSAGEAGFWFRTVAPAT